MSALIHVFCFLFKVFSYKSISPGHVGLGLKLVGDLESLSSLAWFVATTVLTITIHSIPFSITGILVFAFYFASVYNSIKNPRTQPIPEDFNPTLRDKMVISGWGFVTALFLLLPYLISIVL